MQYLKQSTAVTLKIGPFVDDTDGNTAETGLTIAQADVRLSKNGANIAQKTEATSCTHDELGIYGCPADATDTNTLGRLQLWVHESGALPVWHEYMVLPANVYDSMFSTDKLEVDVTQLLGTAWLTPGVAGTPDVNTKLLGGTSQTGNDVGADVNAILTDTGTTLDTLIKDIPTVAEFEARSILSANYVVVSDTIAGVTAVTNDVDITQAGADKVWGTAARALTDKANFSLSTAGILAIWHQLTANIVTANTIGKLLKDDINATISSRSSHSAADIWSVGTRALTDKAEFTLSTAGITAIWEKNISAYSGAGYAGTYLKVVYDDWLNGGRLDLILDAIKAETDTHPTLAEIEASSVLALKSQLITQGSNDFNATAKASINTEVDTALSDIKLDHLIAVADADDPVNDSIIAKMAASDGDWSGFDKATDALEALRDRGDTAWITGAGGSDRLLMVDTTIATLASQTGFTLTAGSADDDAYNNCTIVIEDASTATQKAVGIISNYAGATKTVTLKYDPGIFTIATTDKIYILAENALKSTLANRQINIAADGDIAGNVDGSVGSVTADVGMTQAGADKVWGTAARALTDKAGFSLAAAGITAIWDKDISAYTGAKAGTYLKTVYDDWLNAGRLDLILDTIAADVVNIDGDAMRGTDSANTTTPPTVNEIADQVWDELLTGASHNIATSAGRRLREVGAYAIESGTAQAGTATTITLAATADGGDGIFNRNLIVIVDGTGAGQTRTITDYNNTTKVCVINREWRINPNATSDYQVLADDTPLVVDHGVAQAGTATTITLRDYASATNDAYLCNIIAIIGGTGRGQARLVGSYVGATKVVTICGENWVTTPDTTSVYAMVPYGTSCASCMGATALSEINTECDTALTDYDPPTRTEATADKDAIIVEVDANETKIDTIDGVVDAIKVKTDNLPSGIQKNVALSNFSFLMTDTSDDPKTGLTVTVQVSKDGGAFATVSNSVVEITNGYYKIDLTPSEMNADIIAFKATATGANQTSLVVVTS